MATQMVIHLRPITDRPDVVGGINNPDNKFGPLHGIVYTTSRPRVLITSNKCNGVEREITVALEGVPNQAGTLVHYAGCHDGGMYFYTAKKKWLFDQNFILIDIDPVLMMVYPNIRETESPQVKFCHRQPYYFLQTSSPDIWKVMHFDASKEVENKIVDLRGVSTDNALLLFKNGTLFVLCNGPKELRSRDKNVVVIQDPDLEAKSTAYVEPNNPIIYITHSTAPKLLFLHSETLSLERESISSWVDPEYENVVYNGKVLDIRFALHGLLIIAEITNEGTALGVVQLEDRYWKMEEELESSLRGPESAKDKEKRKKLGQDLAAANSKINQLRKEISQLKQSKINVPNKDPNKKQQQHQQVKKETGTASDAIRVERDRLAAENADLERKYRRMLLLFGRQNLCEPQSAFSSTSKDEKSSLNANKTNPIPKNKTEKSNSRNPQQNTPKKSTKNSKNNSVQEK